MSITTDRFNAIFTQALSAKRSLDKRGYLLRNLLPLVSVFEHDELCKNPSTIAMAGYTRITDYAHNQYIESTDRMSPSRLPKVMEIWFKAQPLSTIGEDTDESHGITKSEEEQDTAAQLTELHTLLYHDASTGLPLIEDQETGLLRPIIAWRADGKAGDCITVVRGSNDNLDALFLEEGDDPRKQNDITAGADDHKYSDRFRANNYLEEEFLDYQSEFVIKDDETGEWLNRSDYFAKQEENARAYYHAASTAFDYPVRQRMENGIKRDLQVRNKVAAPHRVAWSRVRHRDDPSFQIRIPDAFREYPKDASIELGGCHRKGHCHIVHH